MLSTWGSHGLRSWEVVKFESGAPYQVQATMTWDSIEAWKTATKRPDAAQIFSDIHNYTAAKPVSMPGTVQGNALLN